MPNTAVSPDLKGYNFKDFRTEIWGDSFNWSFVRTWAQIDKVAIHHTVTQQKPGETNEQHAQYVANLHKNRGWAGIGYHFLIFRDGTVFYVGDILLGRANIGGNNEKIIGVCLIGDFTKELPSAHQILSAHRLSDYFMTKYPSLVNVTGWDDLMGHKDAAGLYKWAGAEGTTCPSPAWRDTGDSLRNRIIEANYKGYPDWENAKGVPPVPTPTPPTPPVVVPPTPPAPPTPTVITDLTQRVLWQGQTVELRTVYEIIEALNNRAKRDVQVEGIIKGKGLALTKYSAIKKLFV